MVIGTAINAPAQQGIAGKGRTDSDVKAASTQAKLLEVILRILVEAKFLASRRSLRLTPPLLHPDVQRYLRARSDAAVLAAMELKQ